MNDQSILWNKLKNYAESDMYPFHMPGHKRNINELINPYKLDITEIEGFDNLHHPEGILKTSMDWAASVYGSTKTYYLVNGSSGGILSAISAVAKSGERILISRNCHKSVYHGIILNRLKSSYIYPQIIDSLGIQGGILSKDVEESLRKDKDIKAVFIVSPTYDGIISDIQTIADIVHKYDIPLIVDEAHGAHFSFTEIHKSALDYGADLVIQSLHKTLPSLTQTSVLHVRSKYIDMERLEKYLQIYQTSSPSYLFMASIEKCIYDMWKHGKNDLNRMYTRIEMMLNQLSDLKAIQILSYELCGSYGIFSIDESKLIISVRNCCFLEHQIDGIWLSEQFRDKYHLEMEMTGADYVLAMITCMDSEAGLERLVNAIKEIDQDLVRRDNRKMKACNVTDFNFIEMNDHQNCMTLADAFDEKWELLPLDECNGKISAEFIYLYPPGIPIVAPGERITMKMIEMVLDYKKKGLPVQGMTDHHVGKLRVVREE